MNTPVFPSTSLASLARGLWHQRQLIAQMTRRDIIGRYKGSVMGLAWSLVTPLLMLAVYTFIFSVVFKARWADGGEQSNSGFAVVIFTGMIVHGLFAEVLNRAPTLIVSNVNYVRKIVFPLEILPVIAMGTALFHAAVSLFVLLGAYIFFNGYIHWTAIFILLVIFPLLMLSLGLAWMLASLGVFLRDAGQTVSIVTTVMLFFSPAFYPLSAVPEAYRPLIMCNPLTFIMDQARAVLVWGHPPDWQGLAVYTLLSMVVAWGGYAWFQKTRKGFADVL
jgi:lipopolysaccharide transport system permease protein